MSITIWGGVSLTSTGRKLYEILSYYPGPKKHLYISSSYRPHHPGSHHGGRLSYGGYPTAAIDVGFGYPSGNRSGGHGLAEWLMKLAPDTVELIHNPRWYVKNGRRVGPYAVAIHSDHIHFATSSRLADKILKRLRGGKVPSTGGSGSAASNSKYGPAGSVRSIGSQQKIVNENGYTPKLKVDRAWGTKTERGVKWYQKKIGVTADGVWGRVTDAAHKKYQASKKGKSSSKTAAPKPNRSKANPQLKVDGVLGANTWKAVQKNLGVKADGVPGPVTVKALQKRVGAKQDGVAGKETWTKLQQYLNRI